MRKLGKTFGKKYNFKRLLQTTPDLSKKYQQHDDAINSVVPVKHIQLLDYNGPILPTTSAISPKDTIDVEVFGPGQQEEWPRRVKYAEQIPELNNQNYIVWVVRIIEMSEHPIQTPWQEHVETDVVRVARPTVVTYWPDSVNPAVPTAAHRPVNPVKLPKIDQQEFCAYFLSDGNDQLRPLQLEHCGIIPHIRLNFNATFYDQEVANLYAKSVTFQLRHPTSRHPTSQI